MNFFPKMKDILKANMNLNKLCISFSNEEGEYNLDEDINISIYGMSNIRDLKLDNIYIYSVIDNKVANNLNKLYINKSLVNYEDNLIQFSNLKILSIEGSYLFYVLSLQKVDYSSFSKLENLSIELKSSIDYIFLIKILLSSNALKELKLTINIEYGTDYDVFRDNYNDYDENKYSDDEDEGYQRNLNNNSKKLIDALKKIKNLQILTVSNLTDIDYISPFVKSLCKEYKNEQLKCFNNDCLTLEHNQTFLKNNPGVELMEVEVYEQKLKKNKVEEFNFITNEKINIQNLTLKFTVNYSINKNIGQFQINPTKLKILIIKDMNITNSSFSIFIDKNISFDNLIQFKLKNENINKKNEKEGSNILLKFAENLNNFKKLKILSIMDKCIDGNFVKQFIEKIPFNLTKLVLETKKDNYDMDIMNDYYINLFPNLKSIEKLKISLENKEKDNK